MGRIGGAQSRVASARRLEGRSPGFARLRRVFCLRLARTATSRSCRSARRNDIRWDAILGSEIAGDSSEASRLSRAAEALNLQPANA